MKIILLGTNGFLPTDQAHTACYLLPEPGVLLDAGSGAYRLPQYLQTLPLDVYITHAHGDHTSGLVYLFGGYFKKLVEDAGGEIDAHTLDGFTERANAALHATRIHGSPAALLELRGLYGRFQYQFLPLRDQEPLPGGGVLTHFQLDHGPCECTGYRLDWPGHSMAYVTDTVSGPDSTYFQAITGVDLLLHEANNPDRSAELAEAIHHTTPSLAARASAAARVKRLVLIHHSPLDTLDIEPDLAQARRIFPDTQIGRDGMSLEF